MHLTRFWGHLMVTKVRLSLNKRGFTLLEVLLALGLLTGVVALVANIQFRTFDRLVTDRNTLQKTYICRRYLQEMLVKMSKSRQQKDEQENPALRLKATLQQPEKKSVLAAYAHDLYIAHAEVAWDGMGKRKEKLGMYGLALIPDQHKKKQEAAP